MRILRLAIGAAIVLTAGPAVAGFLHGHSSGSFPADTVVTTFSAESVTTGNKNITVGIPLADGVVASSGSLSVPGQFKCQRSWNSGSCKHGIASFNVSLTADTPLEIQVLSTPYASGTDLTAADIDAANLPIVVDLDTYGTVTFTDFDSTPIEVPVAGPEMIEAVYATDVGADPNLIVKVYVQYYADGDAHARVVVINGNSDTLTGGIAGLNHPKTFSPATVTIDGNVAWTGSFTQDELEFWTADGWIGTNPEVYASFDMAYVRDTKLVPNYWKTASESMLAALDQTYVPGDRGPFIAAMASGGFQTQIGLMTKQGSAYFASGDERAFNAMVVEAGSIGAFPIMFLDATTYKPMRPSVYNNWSPDGPNAGGNNSWVTDGVHNYDLAHHPLTSYGPYLVTGERFFLDILQHQALLCYLAPGKNAGLGIARVTYRTEQLRHRSWCDRTLGVTAAIAPVGEEFADEIRALLASRIDNYKALSEVAGQTLLGFYDAYSGGGFPLPAGTPYGDGYDAMWQYDFRIAAHGWALDMDALSDETNLEIVFALDAKTIIGRLGDGSSGTYCWNYFAGNPSAPSSNTIKVAPTDTADTLDWYDSWGDVFDANFPATSCTADLQGTSTTGAETNYIGNALPGIAYVVDYNEPGAAIAWSRLTGAGNWNEVEAAGFEDVPIWGVVPRGYE